MNNSFNTKNKKLRGLMSKNKSAKSNYSTPLKKFVIYRTDIQRNKSI